MKRGLLTILFLMISVFAFAGIKIEYQGKDDNGKVFSYVLITDSGKMKVTFSPKDSKKDENINILFVKGKMYIVNEKEKSYMDFGMMPQQKKKNNKNVDWNAIKKTGKSMKIASYTCSEYKYTDPDNGKILYIYVSKNKKLLKAIKSISKALKKVNMGPLVYDNKQKGVMLGIKEKGQMIFKATKILIGKISAKTFSLKGYKKFDMGGLMEQLKMNMKNMGNKKDN